MRRTAIKTAARVAGVTLALAVWSVSAFPASAQAPARVESAVEAAMRTSGSGETRALLVAVDGKTIAARYGRGYSADIRFVSWSMAKTVTALALGMLYDDGKIALDAPAPVAAWRTLTDGREKITTRHLLTMTSGLQHQEGNERGMAVEKADTVRLLFSDGAQDAAAYAVSRPLAHAPGTHWQYSTATTHILADIITNAVTSEKNPDQRRKTMAAWFKARLWDPLGITSAEWDFDNAGLFLGGSMLHMTAPDYLKLGHLLLDRGVVGGKRIVSEAWIDVLLTPAAAKNNTIYAGQTWLNVAALSGQNPVLFHPKGGAKTYALVGHLGQYIVVVPDRRAVIVRLGKSTTAERVPVREALGDLIDSLGR